MAGLGNIESNIQDKNTISNLAGLGRIYDNNKNIQDTLASKYNSEKQSYKDAVLSNQILLSLAKEDAMNKLIDSDKQLYDSSLDVIPGLGSLSIKAIGKVIPKAPHFTVYHGTSPSGKASIQDSGLLTKYTGQEGTLTNKALEDTNANELSKGLAFTTSSKWDAARYAASHDPLTNNRIDSSSSIIDQTKKFGRQVKSYITDDGIVEMTLPNNMYRHEVLNPEASLLLSPSFKNIPADGIPSKYQQLQSVPDFASSSVNSVVAANGFGKDKVFSVDIPSNFIKGSKNYSIPTSKDSLAYGEFLSDKEELARKLNDVTKNLDISKRIATHSAINNSLKNSSAEEGK